MTKQKTFLDLRKLPRVGYDPVVDGFASEFGSNTTSGSSKGTVNNNSNTTSSGKSNINTNSSPIRNQNQIKNKLNKVKEIQQQYISIPSAEDLERLQPYKKNGLEYISTLPFVIERDSYGNIKLTEDAVNQKIIIEPNTYVYLNESVINTIDTQFKYFKFPRTIITTPISTGSLDVAFINEFDSFSEFSNKVIDLLEKQVEDSSASGTSSSGTSSSGTSNSGTSNSGTSNSGTSGTVSSVPTLTVTSVKTTLDNVELISGGIAKKSKSNNKNFVHVTYKLGNVKETSTGNLVDSNNRVIQMRGFFVKTDKKNSLGSNLYTKADNADKQNNFLSNATNNSLPNLTFNNTTKTGTWGKPGQSRIEVPNDQKKDGIMSFVVELGYYTDTSDAKDFNAYTDSTGVPIRFSVDNITISK